MSIDKRTVGLQLGNTMKIVGKHIHEAFDKSGENVTMQQFFLLLLINYKENITQHEIAIMANKDKSAVLRQTDELEKKRLVVRIPDSDDRRKKILMLTKKGVETMNKLIEIEGRVWEKFLKDVNPDHLILLSEVLNKISTSALE